MARLHLGFEGVSGFVSVVKPDGRETQWTPYRNLILNQGLDQVASNETNVLTRYLAYGDSTNPVKRDSSTTTASRSGTTVTASAGFFEAADVGRIIKWDTGEEATIQSFTSTTVVETVGSGTISAGQFTIHYVDDIGLGNESGRVSTFRTDTGDNQTTLAAGVFTHKRTHLSNAFGAAATVRELAWSPNSSAGNNIFNRVLLGSPIALQVDDRLKVVSNLELVQSPQTSQASNPSASGDWTTELNGNIQIEGVGLSKVESSGQAIGTNFDNSGNSLEPSATTQFGADTSIEAFTTYGTSNTVNSGTHSQVNATLSTYNSGDYFIDKIGVFDVNDANFAIGSILLGSNSQFSGLRHVPTTPPTKDSDHRLTVNFRFSWSRVLVN